MHAHLGSTCCLAGVIVGSGCFFVPEGNPPGASGDSSTDSSGGGAATSIDAPMTGSPTGEEPPTTGAEPPTSGTTDATPALDVLCGTPPEGARDAAFHHQPTATGGVPPYTWSAPGLPPGLTIDSELGRIEGVPTTAGVYDVELELDDSAGSQAKTTCPPLVVNPALTVDRFSFEADGSCIVGGTRSIRDYLMHGDGSPITCSVPAALGDGELPAGLEVDPDTCTIVGDLAEERHGTWSWIVAAEQSGARVYAPYCATQPLQAPKAYAIFGSHSGAVDNNVLVPLVVKFDKDQPLFLGGEAAPQFQVTKGTCGDSCFFGFLYRVTMSPFGSGSCTSDPDGCFGLCPLVAAPNEPDGDKQVNCPLLPTMGSPKTGFGHEFWAKGDPVPPELRSRPFVVQWSIDYCLSDTGADCQGKDAILANGDNSNLQFPVIFYPL